MHPKKWPSQIKIGLILIIIGSVIFSAAWHFGAVLDFFGVLMHVLSPVFLGFSIAYVINVPMSKMERGFERLFQKLKWNVKPSIITAVSLILSLIFIGSLLVFLIWCILPYLIDSIKTATTTLHNSYPNALKYLEDHGINTDFLRNAISSFNFDGLVDHLKQNLNQILKFSYSAVSTVISSIFMYFTAFILALYMLANKKMLKKQFKRLLDVTVSPKISREIQSVLRIVNRSFSNFIAGQCLEALILGVIFYVTLTILSIPYAFLLSVLIAVTALIPYVGAFLGFFVGAAMILFIDPLKALIFAITFFVLQQLEGQLIYPRVVGKSVGLPPVWTLIAVMIGGQVSGVLGMLLFIPLTSVFYALIKQYVVTREAKKCKSEHSESENHTE